jgi:hypothetical protein
MSVIVLACFLLHTPASPPEHWTAYSRTADAFTGDVTFTPNRITFANGASLPIEPAGTLPGYKTFAKQVESRLFRVTAPAAPVLHHGNRLCEGDPVTDLVVSEIPARPPLTPALIALDAFSGEKNCGNYNFERAE